MRAMPRLRIPVLLLVSLLSVSSILGCTSEPKKQTLAPIIDGNQQQSPPPQQNQSLRRPRPAAPIALPPPVIKRPIDQDLDNPLTKYFGYGWTRAPFNPERGLVGYPTPLWVLIALVLGLLCGAFFSERFRRFRRYIFLAIGVLIAIYILLTKAPLAYLGWFLVGYAIAWFFLRLIMPPGKPVKPTTFGSAEWADLDHIRERDLTGTGGYILGHFVAPDRKSYPIRYTGDRHLLTVAPTRAGKGVSAIIPNLLTYTGSALVIDPKGENARITSRARKAMGQAIHVVDPWGITGLPVSTFNPLDWLDATDPDVAENAFMLADAMIIRSGKGESTFWDDESAALLWGLILYVALDTTPNIDRSLAGVRDLINLPEQQFDELLKTMYQSKNDVVSSTGARTLSKEPKVKSNVLTSLQAQTHFLDSPRIRTTLRPSARTFKFEDLKAEKVTVYLVLPADRLGTFGRWLRLMIQQAITVNARNIEIKPDKPILFLLDEMAALGRLTKVEEAFGLMAGFGMQLWGIVQDLSQLDRIYDKGWETFIGNSGVLQYLGSRDLKTAEYFSKLCGVGTIVKVSFSRSIARAFGKSGDRGGSSITDGTNTDHIQRPLAFPDELMVMRKGQSLLLIEANNPIDTQRIYWYRDPQLKALGDSIQ